ncbi:MAG: zinc ribbon domain-containing protein [Steroidobacteraceae bacterium]
MVHCRACGKEIPESATACPQCGATQTVTPVGSDKRILPALLLCFQDRHRDSDAVHGWGWT